MSETTMQNIHDSVAAAIQKFEDAIKLGDAAAVAALYSRDDRHTAARHLIRSEPAGQA